MKRFKFRGFLILQNARNHAGNGVDHHHSREFSSGEHIVPDGYLIGNNRFKNPLIDPFIMTAEEDQILLFCQFFRHALVKMPPLGGHIDHTRSACHINARRFAGTPHLTGAPCADPFLHRHAGVVYRLCLHEHPGASSIGIVIHLFMLIHSIIPYVYRLQTDMPVLDRSSQDAGCETFRHHLWKQGQDMEMYAAAHEFPPASKSPSRRCTRILPCSTSTSRMHSLIAGIRTWPPSARATS